MLQIINTFFLLGFNGYDLKELCDEIERQEIDPSTTPQLYTLTAHGYFHPTHIVTLSLIIN